MRMRREWRGGTSPMEAIKGSSKQVEFAKMTSPSDQSKSRNEPFGQSERETETERESERSDHIDIGSLVHPRREHITKLFVVFVDDGRGLLVEGL
jgi:hypothetical protein